MQGDTLPSECHIACHIQGLAYLNDHTFPSFFSFVFPLHTNRGLYGIQDIQTRGF